MSEGAERDAVLERLKAVQASTSLPRDADQAAKALIARLSSSVRVTLMGPSATGKSTLRNVLAGSTIIPGDLELPSTVLKFGPADRIVATLSDGSKTEIPGLDFAALQSGPVVFAEIYTPNPVLKQISLLEIVADGGIEDLTAAAKWGAGRTDIAVWITTSLNPEEQTLWEGMPDALKDHSFLVLNKIDRLHPSDQTDLMDQVELFAEEQFFGSFAVAARFGLAALENGPSVDSKAFKSSGCQDFRKALIRHAQLGTQADIDSALMYLSKFETAETRPPARPVQASAPEPAPAAEAPAAEEAPEPAPEPLEFEAFMETSAAADDGERRDSCNAALSYLRSSAEAMLGDLADPDQAAERVLDRCAETVADLAVTLSDDSQLSDQVEEANDVIVLLQLEKTEAAAEDAAVALLQLKREIELALAA